MDTEGHAELKPWHVHGERIVYDSPWVRVSRVDVEPPGVARFEHHVVRLRRVAIAAVLDAQERVLMLWRYRFVSGRWGWELPGGIVEPGEDGAAAAARETEEETGWRPDALRHLVSFEPMIGMVDNPHEVYVGRGASHVGDPTDPEEAGRIEWIPLADVPDLLSRNELAGSGTLIALLHIMAFRGQ